MSQIKISTIIPTCNRLDLLKRTLVCMEKQTVDPESLQIVVIDDGSTDGTPEYLENYSSRFSFEAVLFSNNQGRSAVRNAGVDKALGAILLFIDGDMEFDSNLIKNHFEKHLSEEIVILGRVIYDKSLPYRGYRRYIETRGANKLPPGEPLPGRYFLSGHVSMPAAIFSSVGGYDESFKVHGGEDLDLGMRIVCKSNQMRYDPNLVMTHLHIRSLEDVLNSAYQYGFESIPQLVKKHQELKEQLRLDFLERNLVIRLLRKIILSGMVYQPLRFICGILNVIRAPAILYDYLLFRNYFMGYLKGKEL